MSRIIALQDAGLALAKNCLSCSHYLKCDEPDKSFAFVCRNYRSTRESISQLTTLLQDASEILPPPHASVVREMMDPSSDEARSSRRIRNQIVEALGEHRIVSPDVKFPERDFPEAPNFVTWCASKEFLDQAPFASQAVIFTNIFSEWCSDCSDKEYMDGKYDVDDTVDDFRNHVTLLEHGTCPKCKQTRTDLINARKLNAYNEGAVCAGQRCVTADTRILTADGLMHIGEYAEGRPLGFSEMHLAVHNGQRLETTSHFYRARPEKVRRLRLYGGIELRGTDDHPIKLADGKFKRLSEVSVGAVVPLRLNQQQFGNKIVTRHDIEQALRLRLADKFPKTYLQNFATVDADLCAVLGLWIAEGRRTHISNVDPEVNAFIYETLSKYVNRRYIRKSDVGVTLIEPVSRHFLCVLLGLNRTSELSSGSASKCVPYIVRTGTKAHQTAFLAGLFEGDGSVGHDATKKHPRISHCTISKSLSDDVSAMLFNLGVYHRIRTRDTWATNGTEKQVSKKAYNISIGGEEYVRRYSEQIGFLCQRKKRRLENALARYTNQTNDVPFTHQSLAWLKSDIDALLLDIRSELKQLPRSRPMYEVAHRTGVLGLSSIFGRKFSNVGFSVRKHIGQTQRVWTKNKVCKMLTKVLEYSSYLSDSTKFRIAHIMQYTSDDVVCVPVLSNDYDVEEATYDFTLPDTHQFVTHGIISHNSGKSAGLAMAFSYLTHRMLKMEKPIQIYGVMRGQMLHGTYVALTYAQAKDTLYDPYYAALLDSPWFQSYCGALDDVGARYGEEMYKLKDTFAMFRHRGIYTYPAGPDKRILRGRTRIFGAIDELGWFPHDVASSKNVKMNAKEVYIALERSLLTVRASASDLLRRGFNNIPTGYFINISSPSSVRDMIMELVRKSVGSRRLYGIVRATWEMNPKVPREEIDEEFRKDPVAAMRDYGAQPPLSSNPFIASKAKVEDAQHEKRLNPCKITYKTFTARDGTKERYAQFLSLKPIRGKHVLALDAGYSNNSFAATLTRLNEDSGKVECTLMVEIQPLPGLPLNHGLIYKHILSPIMEKFDVRVIAADRWQSLKLLADAEVDFGVVKVQHSLKYGEMHSFKQYLMDDQFVYPKLSKDIDDILAYEHTEYPLCFKDSPADHFALQCLTVQDTGLQVIKGDNLTDDLLRSAMLGQTILLSPKYEDAFADPEEEVEQVRSNIPVQNRVFLKKLAGVGTRAAGQVTASGGSKVRGFIGRRKL